LSGELTFAGRLRQLILDDQLRQQMSKTAGVYAARHEPVAVAKQLVCSLVRQMA
jgi:hypothetical protein